MSTSWKKFLFIAGLFGVLTLALPCGSMPAALAAGAGGHAGGGGGHSGGGSDSHHDTHSGDGSHSDHDSGDEGDHGGSKGPQYRGGRGGVSHGHTSDGHSVEDHIFHGKHGKRWSDEWSGGHEETDGEEHSH